MTYITISSYGKRFTRSWLDAQIEHGSALKCLSSTEKEIFTHDSGPARIISQNANESIQTRKIQQDEWHDLINQFERCDKNAEIDTLQWGDKYRLIYSSQKRSDILITLRGWSFDTPCLTIADVIRQIKEHSTSPEDW